MLQTRLVGRWEEQLTRLLPPSSWELQLQRARTRAPSSPGLSLCPFSPKCVEVEFSELRLEGVLESGNRKPYSSKPPKGFKLTSPRCVERSLSRFRTTASL